MVDGCHAAKSGVGVQAVSNEKVKLHLKSAKKNYRGFTVIDFETTGFSAVTNEVIEYAAVKVRDGEITDSVSHLCRPKYPIGRSIKDLTGITNSMVRDCEPFSAYLTELLGFFADDVVAAHNAPFDLSFLLAACGQCGIRFPNRTACTLAASRAAFPHLSNHKLQTVAQYLNVASDEQHRALGDAMATAKILIHILNQHNGL